MNNMTSLVHFSIQDEQIGIMTLNRSERANSLSAPMLEEINQLIQEIKHDESIRCLLITEPVLKSFALEQI